ncbi:unnamed protein product [Rotaria sp. Silwood2]|nr:unnamed protein product [Rotaria sp. Silwood2]
MQTLDAECERELCSKANKGLCRYKDGECKYRHTRCHNYDSCLHSKCPLAHASQLSAKQCSHGIRCFKPDCPLNHPEGWSACDDGVQCSHYECNSNHPPARKGKCPDGNLCNTNNCKFLHPNMHPNECSWGIKCRQWVCTKTHPISRTHLCPKEDHCNNDACGYLHPPKYAKLSKPIAAMPLIARNEPIITPHSGREQPEIIELSVAEQNFLGSFGKKILDKIREEEGIKDVKVKDGKLQLSGNSSAIANIKSYLKQTLHEKNVTIKNNLKKYLLLSVKGRLMKRFKKKYSTGISYLEISTNAHLTTNDMITIKNCVAEHDKDERGQQCDIDRNVDQSEDEQKEDDDDNDRKSDISNASSSVTNILNNFKHHHLLCKAIKGLQNYSLHTRSWALTQDEITYILKQPQLRTTQNNKSKVDNQRFQITDYLSGLVRSTPNSVVEIFVDHKNGIWRVKVRGFKDNVNNAISKIQNWLNDNIETEVQLSISKVMAIFLRTKASADIKKMEKTDSIKITIMSAAGRKNGNDEQDDNHDCLKLSGSYSRISSAREKSWDVSKIVSQSLRTRLKELRDSDDCEAIGWIKIYTAIERRETAPKVTISIAGLNEEAVDMLLNNAKML